MRSFRKWMLPTEKYSSDYLINKSSFRIDTNWILSKRGPKHELSSKEAYAFFVEDEFSINGIVEPVATIFLTNRECPFKCLMCDLWKNTLDHTVEPGSISEQIERALKKLPTAKHIKLYNSGNFFDKKAIPQEEYKNIAELCEPYETVLVEAHPKFIGPEVIEFQKLISGNLQVAIGLETVNPGLIEVLNKRMTLEDFKNAVAYLNKYSIQSRAFILLRPPFMTEEEGLTWAKNSVEFAFEAGVECVSIIPTRAGNGALDELEKSGDFSPPLIKSLEEVQHYSLSLKKGRSFADLWDIEKFHTCDNCNSRRVHNISQMNETQVPITPQECDFCP